MKPNFFITAIAILISVMLVHAVEFNASEYSYPMYQKYYYWIKPNPPTYSSGERIYEGSVVCWDHIAYTDSLYYEYEAYDSGLPLVSNVDASRICRTVNKSEYDSDRGGWFTSFGVLNDAIITYSLRLTRIDTKRYNVLYNNATNEIILRRYDDSIRYIGTVFINPGSRPKTVGNCYTRRGNKLNKIVTNASACK